MAKNLQGTFAVSAVALISGGTLTILQQAIAAAAKIPQWQFVFLVHDATSLPRHENVTYISLPTANQSYLKRLYTEYVLLNKISKQINADIWLSLHDTTPRVQCQLQAVYCHNSLPYWRPKFHHFRLHAFEVLRAYLYGWVYRFRAQKNHFVIAQQPWFAEFLRNYLNLTDERMLIVAPDQTATVDVTTDHQQTITTNHPTTTKLKCFYPALPRVFKNIEEAIAIIRDLPASLTLTLTGDENRYARYIHKLAPQNQVEFLGQLPHAECLRVMQEADVILFPSSLETFGLPVAEAMALNRRLLLPRQPWTLAIAAAYDKAYFYDDIVQARSILNTISTGQVPERDGIAHDTKLTMAAAARLHGFVSLFRFLIDYLPQVNRAVQ